jgi:hypothetical protein
LSAITVKPENNIPASSGSYLVYVKLTGDEYNIDPCSPYATRTPLLEKVPAVLIPINVTRRRRTNAEEIEATITNLSNDRAALIAATGKAENIANLVYSSASHIAGKKWWADFNPVRRKWIWAIRRVIRQKLVKETKEHLATLEKKKQLATESQKYAKRNSVMTKAHEI